MDNLNRMKYDHRTKLLSVEAGARWKEIISYLSTFERTPAVMQSYYNFSVGGSISVNCHGRDTRYGTISHTVMSLKILLSDGKIVECDRETRQDLFNAVIGGYGLIGIILSAKLKTCKNYVMRCNVTKTPQIQIQTNTKTKTQTQNGHIFYNGNIHPTNPSVVYNYSWNRISRSHGNGLPLIRQSYPYIKSIQEMILRWFAPARHYREQMEPSNNNSTIQWRSYEIGHNYDEHAVLVKYPTTTVLQEYFIPIRNAEKFRRLLLESPNQPTLLNISIRYVKRDKNCLLSYAPVDSYAFVLYFPIMNTTHGLNKLTVWTNYMLDQAYALDGSYYLPYLRSYDWNKIKRMYQMDKFYQVKQKYDPLAILQSQWMRKTYLHAVT